MAEDVGSLVVRVAMENSSFQQGVQNLNRSLKVIQSEFKNATAGLKDHGKGLDGLKAKADMFSKSLDVQTKIVKAYEDKLKESKNTLDYNAKKHIELADSVNKAERAYKNSEKTLGKNAQETQKLKSEYEKLQSEFTKSEEKIINNQRAIDNWSIKTNNAKTGLSELQSELSKTNREVEKQGSAWTKISTHMNDFGNKAKSVGEKLGSVGRTITTHVSAPLALLGTGAAKAAIDFESAFTGVKKTVDGTKEQFQQLEVGIRDMSKVMPQSATEIAGVAEAAGQLGIKTENILGFTKSMIMLGDSTNMSSEEAATALARLANITQMPQNEFDKLGSVIVALGNNMATTERDITEMGLRLAGAGKQVGLTNAQIMGLAAALSSVGIEAEAGGSAMSKVMVDMQLAVEKGGASLEDFAKVAGMSSSQFQKSFKQDAAGALISFIKGLETSKDKGVSAIKVLDDMGITEVRMRDALLRAAGAGDLFNKSISIGTNAWKENTALTNEANQRYETTASKLKMVKNQITDSAITIGNNLLPAIRDMSVKIAAFTEKFSKLSPATQKFTLAIAGIGIVLGPALVGISSLISAVGTISTAFGGLATFLAEKQIATKIAQIFKIPPIPTNMFAGIVTGLETAGAKIGTFIFGPWKALGNAFKSLPGLIKSISFADVVTKIVAPFKNIPALLSGVFAKIPGILNGTKALFTNFGTTIIGLGPKIFGAIKSAFSIQGIMAGARAALAVFTGPWGVLALVIAAGVGAIIKNWDKIKAWVQQHFGGTLPQNFNSFKQVFENVWNSIQETFSNVWNSIKQIATDVWNYIGPTITDGVTAVQSFWNEVWPQIQQVFVEVWNVMKVILGPAVAALYTVISGGLGLIKGAWGPAWNLIKDTLKIVWDAMTGVIRIAWDLISGVIKVGLDLLTGNWSKAWTDMKSIFSNLWSDIKSLFSSMAQDAVTWGKDMIQGIINGIKGAIGGVKDAVTDVANTIRSYLHFTVPDVGPLSDADTYGADFMELLAQTIEQNADKPEKAAKNVADKINSIIKQKQAELKIQIDNLKATEKSKIDELQKQLRNTRDSETVDLRGTKKDTRYGIQDSYKAQKEAIQDKIKAVKDGCAEEVKARKDAIAKEIELLKKGGKEASEQLKKEAEAKKKAAQDIDKLDGIILKALQRKIEAERDAALETAKAKAKESKLTKEQLNSLLNYTKDYYDKKLNQDKLKAVAEQLIMSKNQQAIITLLNKFGNLYEDSGATLGQRMVGGMKNWTDMVPDIVDNAMQNVKVTVKDAAVNIQSTLNGIMEGMQAVGNAGASLGAISSGGNFDNIFSDWKGNKTDEDKVKEIADKYKQAFNKIELAQIELGRESRNSDEELRKQQKTIDLQKEKLSNLNKEYEEMKSLLGENDDEVISLKKDIAGLNVEIDNNILKLKQDEIENKYKKYFDALELSTLNLTRETKNFGDELKLQSDLYINNTLKLDAMKKKYEELVVILGKDADSVKQLEKDIVSLQKEMDDTAKKLNDDMINNINEFNNKVKEALKARYEDELRLHEEKIDKELTDLNKWKDDSIKMIEQVYNARIKSLDDELKAEDKAEKDREELSKINRLKDAMMYEHNEFNKAEMQKELNKLTAERNKRLHKESVEDQKQNLEEQKQNEINNINNIYENNKTAFEKTLEITKEFYKKKLKEANLDAEAQKLVVEKNQKEIVELIKKYDKDYESAGKTLGQKFADGMRDKISPILDMIQSIQDKISSIRTDEIQSALNAVSYVPISSMASVNNSSTVNNNSNSKTVVNKNSFTFNGSRAVTPSEERRQMENMVTKAAFMIS